MRLLLVLVAEAAPMAEAVAVAVQASRLPA
jgi:hypothetical protein